jgi:hypothetical protein
VHVIGASLLYPVMQYKHNVFLRTESPVAANVPIRGWNLFFANNLTNNGNRYSAVGELQPGQTRTYKLAIRVTTEGELCPEPWITTLDPYKNYFRSQYGGVTYQRDGLPIAQRLLSQSQNIPSSYTPPNPYRFFDEPNLRRPDIYGFGSVARYFSAMQDRGFQRMMMWHGAGWANSDPQLNSTFKFATHWLEGNTALFPTSYGHNMADAVDSLPLVSRNGRQLGMWWGNSSYPIHAWNVGPKDTANYDNLVHRQLAMNEMHVAVRAGAKFIGLDAFPENHQAWESFPWLQMLRDSFPDVRFCVEQGSCDILHTLAPFYYYSNRIKTPHFLANYLLPGNEILAHIQANWYIGNGTFQNEMSLRSAQGYTVVDWASGTELLAQPYIANKGWLSLNPTPDLGGTVQLPDGGNVLLNGGCGEAYEYLWSTGATSQELLVTQPGTYWVQVTLNSGCTVSDTVVVVLDSEIAPKARLKARVMLGGPYNTTTKLMGDGLRVQGVLPLNEPYAAAGYAFVGNQPVHGMLATMLNLTGPDAPVDWVIIELRAPDANKTLVMSFPAIVQRDGDIVDGAGHDEMGVQVPHGNYHVCVRHRNHLGTMTSAPFAFSSDLTVVDFARSTTQCPVGSRSGTEDPVSVRLLWAGDVKGDHDLKYVGVGNDRDPILIGVGSTTPNNVGGGYLPEDVNLDGKVKYVGSNNDRDPILLNIGGTAPNNVRLQVPPF